MRHPRGVLGRSGEAGRRSLTGCPLGPARPEAAFRAGVYPSRASKTGSPVWFRLCRVRKPWVLAALAFAVLAIAAPAEIIDRIAVSVGNRVITESDLHREIRGAAFLDGVKPDFSPAGQLATAQRMVEQVLIRRELEISRYPVPSAAEGDR